MGFLDFALPVVQIIGKGVEAVQTSASAKLLEARNGYFPQAAPTPGPLGPDPDRVLPWYSDPGNPVFWLVYGGVATAATVIILVTRPKKKGKKRR